MVEKNYPSTSFSGDTAFVASEESIGFSESNGSWTIIPWTLSSLFNLSTVDKTLKIRESLLNQLKQLETLSNPKGLNKKI